MANNPKSRRDFLGHSALAAFALSRPAVSPFPTPAIAPAPRGFLSLLRSPDRVTVETADGSITLQRQGNDRWTGDHGIIVTTTPHSGSLAMTLAAPGIAIKRVHARWSGSLDGTRLLLGDAWERAYGDLEWRGWVPDRVMPWYFATTDGATTHCYGVRTGANAFCSWLADPRGVTLSADVRSGSVGVQLGERTLPVCDVMSRAGHAGETSFAAVHAFCKAMCPSPRLPSFPVYGTNDWYWAYGNNSAASVREDAHRVVELAPTGANRPFVVIDDGWQPEGGHDKNGAGQWDRGNEKFPDMPALVADVKKTGARAGIWIRALQASPDTPASWRFARERGTLDPSLPEVRHKVAADIARLHDWGFELIKHDYSTYDIFGRWGSTMGTAMTRDGWSFGAGTTQTTAEIIKEFYQTIRTAAGDSIVDGCNTVSHLSAGLFEMCRIGDDTSGNEWPRTRKMGVNSLAFRAAQHGAFYVADGDCVGVTTAQPWSLNRQWLDLLAHSGTTLFASLAPDALGVEQRRDLRAAFALAAVRQPLAEPLDWQHTVIPSHWAFGNRRATYDWIGTEG
jgi:alpha-galactosidase